MRYSKETEVTVWEQELLLVWLLRHLHLVYWIKQDLNPQPIDHESSSLTARQGLRGLSTVYIDKRFFPSWSSCEPWFTENFSIPGGNT